MIKIMLVEDDKSLREIYGVRLLAEGYDIVSAGDGEQALAVAIKERPALIVTDLMMPKISGFDMLDILRSTTETKDIKVIVMTALGSDEQRQRGESLGADRYLVKSQVGIEDVVRTVHEVLADQPGGDAQPAAAATPPAPVARPMAPAVARSAAPNAPSPVGPPPNSASPQLTPPAPRAVPAEPPKPAPSPTITPVPPSIKNRVIQPINDPNSSRVNINELLDKELAREAGIDAANRPPIASTEQEKALVQNQINQFAAAPPPPPVPTDPNAPTISIGSDGQVTAQGVPAAPTPSPAAPNPPSAVNQPVTHAPVGPLPAQQTPAGPPPPPPPVR